MRHTAGQSLMRDLLVGSPHDTMSPAFSHPVPLRNSADLYLYKSASFAGSRYEAIHLDQDHAASKMRFVLATFSVLVALIDYSLGASFTNPLKTKDGSDPFIVHSGDGYYYLLTTTWSNIQVTRSKTLGGLKTGQTKVVWSDPTASRCCNVWAPEVHWIDNSWWIYYTAGTSANLDGQRSHVLRGMGALKPNPQESGQTDDGIGGATPWDTYSYAGQLLNEWAIDATILRFPNKNYFVYSCQRGGLQSLCIAPMNSPTSLGAVSTLSQPTLAWERIGEFPVNEGPAAMYHGGKTYLTYSASQCWSPSYQLGLLTYNGQGDPLSSSSWTKSGPVFSSANGNYGTAHNGCVPRHASIMETR